MLKTEFFYITLDFLVRLINFENQVSVVLHFLFSKSMKIMFPLVLR